MSRFGSRGLIYEASGGDMTKIKELEQMKIYDFYNALAFNREINNRE